MIYHIFNHKLRRNTLHKVVHEQYTRSDVSCSFPCCTPHTYQDIKKYTEPHFVIPTKEVLLTYLPLFESKYTCCIILQSVLNNIKDEKGDYKRVKEATKKQFIFYNNFHESTYVSNAGPLEEIKRLKISGMDAIELQQRPDFDQTMLENNIIEQNNAEDDSHPIIWNDLSQYKPGDFSSTLEYNKIMKTLIFYTQHTKHNFIILTMTNIKRYVNLFYDKLPILDLLTKSVKEKTEYEEHIDVDILENRIKQGTVYKGTMYVNNFNCFSGIVHGKYKGRTVRIKIVGKLDMNRAMHLDTVYVEIKENIEDVIDLIDNDMSYINRIGDSSNRIGDSYRVEDTKDRICSVNNIESLSKASSISGSDDVFGRVVGISSRKYKPIIGTIDKNTINGGGSQFVLVIPLDRKIPKIRIRTSQAEELEGKRIVIKMNEWEKDSYYPFGCYIKRLGNVGDEKSEIESILISNGIDYKNYENEYGIESVIRYLDKKISTTHKDKGQRRRGDASQALSKGACKAITESNDDALIGNTRDASNNALIDNSKADGVSKGGLKAGVEQEGGSEIYEERGIQKTGCAQLNNRKEVCYGKDGKFTDSHVNETSNSSNKRAQSSDSDEIESKKRKLSESKLNELNNTYNKIIEHESKVRCDLRDIDVISIDPPGCTDIDDALHCKVLDDFIEVGVHIADVSYFIEINGILDKESMNRGTTVYLTDRRIDMIPNYLSSNLCSLIENEDRLVFTVLFYFDKNYKISEVKFQKSLIKNRRAFTYEEAQNEMEDGKYKESIEKLNEIAKILKKERHESGAIELSSSEMKIHTKPKQQNVNNNEKPCDALDSESTINTSDKIRIKNDSLPEIDKIEKKNNFETNSLIEEFMLLANVAVANKLYENLKDCSLLRRHPKFADDSFDELKEYLEKKNINLNYLSSKELNESIKAIKDGQFKEMIKKIITRSMNQAVYFSSGSVPYEEFFHYGLAMPIYTHFTSPIRRYADLVVHRQLEYILNKDEMCLDYDNNYIEDICKNINYRNRSAMYANLECDKLFVYLYIKGRVIEDNGYIVRVRKNGVVIYVPCLGIEDTVLVDYEFNDNENSFYNEGKKVFGLYDNVKVIIKENDDKFFIERHFDIEILL